MEALSEDPAHTCRVRENEHVYKKMSETESEEPYVCMPCSLQPLLAWRPVSGWWNRLLWPKQAVTGSRLTLELPAGFVITTVPYLFITSVLLSP